MANRYGVGLQAVSNWRKNGFPRYLRYETERDAKAFLENAYAKADTNRVSADVALLDVAATLKDLHERVTNRKNRSLLARLSSKQAIIGVLIAACLHTGAALAAKEYMAFGLGVGSCGQWTVEKQRDSATYYQMAQWVLGYLTAYSRWAEETPGPVANAAAYGVIRWMDNFCQINPLDNVAKAAQELIYELRVK